MDKCDPSGDQLLDAIHERRSRLKHGTCGDTRDMGSLPIAEARHRDLFDHAPDMFGSVDAATGVILDCNQNLATALGATKADVLGRSVSSLHHADCLDDVERACHSLVETGEVHDAELLLQRQDGSTIDVSLNASSIRDDTGRVVRSWFVWRDISRRKRAEVALRASQARYENLYDDAPDMFASVDVATERIVQCNQTLVTVSGCSREELLGRPVREIHDPGCWPVLAEALVHVRQTGRVRDVELQLTRHGALIDVSLSAAAISDERDNLYYRATWRDVTERKRAQLALHQKQRELEHSRQELQALAARLMTAQEDERQRLSRELHDDLNQRLALLALEIETLERDLPESRPTTLARLRVLHDHVVALSNDVHTLAYQLHPSILDDLGLSAALESLTDDFTQREGIPVDIVQSVPDSIAPDVGSCLYRVSQEALRNVARHARSERVTLTLTRVEDGISLMISDSGLGFVAEATTGPRQGLGIVSMQERVRLVNGRFSLTSHVGEGTQVRVWVPLPKEER